MYVLSCGVDVVRFLHTETQDGKGLIDAHFARGSQHCIMYMRTGRNISTPTELLEAL